MDKLIGDRAHHPSLGLEAGQVIGFTSPTSTAQRCTICGQLYTDTAYHPDFVWTAKLGRVDSTPVVHTPTVVRL